MLTQSTKKHPFKKHPFVASLECAAFGFFIAFKEQTMTTFTPSVRNILTHSVAMHGCSPDLDEPECLDGVVDFAREYIAERDDSTVEIDETDTQHGNLRTIRGGQDYELRYRVSSDTTWGALGCRPGDQIGIASRVIDLDGWAGDVDIVWDIRPVQISRGYDVDNKAVTFVVVRLEVA